MEEKKESSPLLPAYGSRLEDSIQQLNLNPKELGSVSKETFNVYKRRWYILALYTLIALVCNMNWNTWGPISEPCQIIFGWANWQVLLLTSWAAISAIISAGPSTYLMDVKGLRSSVILCIFLLTAGKALQIIPCSNPLTRTILLNAGQGVVMLSSPVGLGGPPSISATWFPPNERTFATAISTLLGYVGLPLAFIIGPNVVQVIVLPSQTNNSSSATIYDTETMSQSLNNYMELQLGASGFLLACALVYFPNKPPLPPSETSGGRHHGYTENLKMLLCERSYLHLLVIFAISYGVYFGWVSVFAIAVKPFGVDETLAGWLGTAAIMAGIFSGVCLGRYSDYVKRQTKSILIFLFFGTTLSQLIFSLTCSNVIRHSKAILFSSIIFGGLFFNATTPLLFEMAIEAVYPIAEGITAIFLLVTAYFIYLFFTVAFMFPVVEVTWMNWATVVFNGLCVPGLLFYKAKFKRLEKGEML